MQLLRAILIVFLAISIPLPSLAAAFGAPPCMEMSAAESAVADQTQMSEAEQQDECGCGQCDNCAACAACDAPCATGGTATLNKAPQAFNLLPLQSPRTTALRARALPAHPEDLIRPPSLIQS